MKKKQKQYKKEHVDDVYMTQGLLNGASWDEIRESYSDFKEQQQQRPPTETDILTDWILSKDVDQEQGFAYGGKKFQNAGKLTLPKNILLPVPQSDNPLPVSPLELPPGYHQFQSNIIESPTELPEIKSGLSWNAIDNDTKKAILKENLKENASQILGGATVGLGIIGDKVNDYYDGEDRFNSAMSDVNSVASYNPQFMSTTQALNQYNMIPTWTNKTNEDMGVKNGWQIGLGSLANGLQMGLATGNP